MADAEAGIAAAPVGGDPADAADAAELALAARAAGDIALGFFRAACRRWDKDDKTPVSEADLAVDLYLRERLLGARPDYGWLSEETVDNERRLAAGRVFIVDPIDGTSGFLAGSLDWTISIAVVEAGRPIAAALYQPATDEMYGAHRGGGAHRDGARLAASHRATLAGARLAGSSRVLNHPAAHARQIERAPFIPSLALRIARVAAGALDGTVTTSGPRDWDLAAADLLVHEAGGALTNLEGCMLTYNRADTRHRQVAAGSGGMHADLVRLAAIIAQDGARRPA